MKGGFNWQNYFNGANHLDSYFILMVGEREGMFAPQHSFTHTHFNESLWHISGLSLVLLWYSSGHKITSSE